MEIKINKMNAFLSNVLSTLVSTQTGVIYADVCAPPVHQRSATWQLIIQNLLIQRLLIASEIFEIYF